MRIVVRSLATVILVASSFAASGSASAQSPTPMPSPAPVLVDAPITALDWPAPIAGPGLLIDRVLPYGGGLVAVGQEQDGVTSRAAAWWSVDGSTWERTLLDGPRGGYSAVDHVVATPTALVAMGPDGRERCSGGGGEGEDPHCHPIPVAVWHSADGRTWERVNLHGTVGRGRVGSMAAGASGLVAVGADRRGAPTAWRSPDGLTWEATSLTGPAFDRAWLADLATIPDGWVLVGSTGGRETAPGGVGTPNGSAGAAWTSTDGIAWTPARVDGTGEQVELRSVFVGRDGLIAIGSLDGSHTVTTWTSTDGTVRALQDPAPDGVETPIPVASDGRHIVGTTSRFDDAHTIDWWISTDGVAWTELAATGATDTTPRWDGGIAPDVVSLTNGTLVVLGQDGDHEAIWLAHPVEAPA